LKTFMQALTPRNPFRISRGPRVAAALVAGALALTLAGCGSDDPLANGAPQAPLPEGNGSVATSTLSGHFAGAGASTQENSMAAWIATFQDGNPDVTISYDPSGSGAGRTQFLAGGVLWAGSDAALNEDEIQTSLGRCGPEGAIDLPVYISAIAVAFNLDGIDTLNLNAENIAKIFTGQITNWNDPAIAADNPGVDLPNLAITPVHRSDSSGTTLNFVDYLYAKAPSIWTWTPAGTWPTEGGASAAGTTGVVNVVNQTAGAITYADLGAVGANLGVAAIQVGDTWQVPTAEGAAIAIEVSPSRPGRHEHDMSVDIDRLTEADGAYPLVLVSYVVVCLHYENEMEGNFIREFVTFLASDQAQQLSAQVADSAPITPTLRDQVLESVNAITVGNN